MTKEVIPVEFRDCRLCANFTTASSGCVSVLQCIDSDRFKETAPRTYWQVRALPHPETGPKPWGMPEPPREQVQAELLP